MTYPIMINSNLYQYDSHLYVWFDEAGIPSGAAPTQAEAQRQLDAYGASLSR